MLVYQNLITVMIYSPKKHAYDMITGVTYIYKCENRRTDLSNKSPM